MDGVCLFLARDVLDAVGRLRRGLRVLPRLRPRPLLRGAGAGPALRGGERARSCTGAGARGRARTHRWRRREDLAQRQAALARFAEKWAHRLPCDVRGRPRAPARLAPRAREGMMPRMIPFAKGHGLGNDYIVINGADLPVPAHPGAGDADLRSQLGRGLGRHPAPGAGLGRRRLRPPDPEPRRQRGREIGQWPAHLRQVPPRPRPRQARHLHGGHHGRAGGVPLPRDGRADERGHRRDGPLHVRGARDPHERSRARGGEGPAPGGRRDPARHRGLGGQPALRDLHGPPRRGAGAAARAAGRASPRVSEPHQRAVGAGGLARRWWTS